MKKIILICLLAIIGVGAYSQPVVQRANKANTVADGRIMANLNDYIPRYADTATANTQIGIDSAGAVIYTYDIKGFWYRQHSPKKWVRVVSDNLLSNNFFFDSTCNCYKLDTSSVAGIVNNFINDSSIVSISILNDSTVTICYSSGSCVNVGFVTNLTNLTNVYFLGGDSIAVCKIDTTSGIVTNVCDTVTLGTRPSSTVYQNWLRNTGANIIEFGSNSPSYSPGLFLEHNTYTNTGYYKMNWDGYTVYDYPHTFSQQQSFQIGSGIAAFRGYGNLSYSQPNSVRLGINFSADTNNRSPFIAGAFGAAIGYSLGTNWQEHGSYGLYLDDNNAKTTGVFFHLYDSTTTDGVTIYAAPDLGGTVPVFNGLLKNYRVTGFKTNLSLQHYGYGSGSSFISSDTTSNKPLAVDASGNQYRMAYWPGSGGLGNPNSNIGSGYRLAVPFTNNIKTLFGSATVLIDSTSNTNALTIKVDTSIIATDTDVATKQNLIKWGADFTTNVDSLFLKGAWVNVKDFGAVGNGVTNDRAAFVAAVATGKNVFVPQGTFLISASFDMGADQTLFGLGWGSILKTTANDRIVAVGNRTTITGLHFIGSGKADGKSFQTGVLLYNAVGWNVTNCYFEAFSGTAQQNGGGGIYGAAVSPSNSDGGRIENCYFYNNNGGLVLSQRAEYVTIVNCTMGGNTVGLGLGAGNISVVGCTIQNNTTGIKAYSGTNSGHNTISGCLINHNIYPLDIQDITHDVGFQFNGNMIYFGAIIFTNANNIKFSGGNIDQMDSIRIDNSRFLQRTGVFWGTTTLGNAIPVSIANGGENFSVVGEIRKDATTVNNWIKQIHDDTVWFNKRFFLDSLVAQTDTTTWKPMVYNTTTKQLQYSQNWVGGISAITADNGLTASTSTNVQLGSTSAPGSALLHDSYIDATASYHLKLTGAETAGNGVLQVRNTSTGRGIFASAVDNDAIQASSTNAAGLSGLSTNGYGVTAFSSNSVAGDFQISPASTNAVEAIAQFSRYTTGTAANGIGLSVRFFNQTTTLGGFISNTIVSKWTDAAAATRTSQFIITGVNNSVSGDIVQMDGDGTATFLGGGTPTNTVRAINTSNTALKGESTTGNAINGAAGSSGTGGVFSSISGLGIQASSVSSFAADLVRFGSSTNDVLSVGKLRRETASTAANGIGGSLDYYLEDASNTVLESNRLISIWTDAANATRTSQFKITGVNSATTSDLAYFNGDGYVKLPGNGSPLYTLESITAANYAIYGHATGAGVGVLGATFSNGGIGIYGQSNTGGSSIGVKGESSSGIGIQGTSVSGLPASFTANSSSTNTVTEILRVISSSSGTPAAGIGASINFQELTSNGSSYVVANKLISSLLTATTASETSQFKITGMLGGSTVDVFTANGDGSWQIRPITATAASAITPAEGMIVFVSSTNGTFGTIGLYSYQNGSWHAL